MPGRCSLIPATCNLQLSAGSVFLSPSQSPNLFCLISVLMIIDGGIIAKKRVFTISFLSIIGLLLIVGGYWVFGALFSVDKTIPPEKLAKIETGSIAKSVVATGKVEPLSKVDIKSKASGLIKYLYVNAGDRVREGQLLLELDKETLEAQLKEAKAILQSAESNLRETEFQGKTLR